MSKFDVASIVADVQKLYTKDTDRVNRISVGDSLKSMADGEFITMPPWYQTATNTKGLPFGGMVMIAGDSDSGKTSCAIAAMKAAQEQDVAIIYVETEGKTTTQDLVNWGVDPSQVMLVKSSVAEEAFDMLFKMWDGFSK